MLLNVDMRSLAEAAEDTADRWNKIQAFRRDQLRAAFKGDQARYQQLETILKVL